MKLQYKEEHIRCAHYATHDKALFCHLNLSTGDTLPPLGRLDNALLYVEQGSLAVSLAGSEVLAVPPGYQFILSRGAEGNVRATAPTRVMACAFSSQLMLCNHYSLYELRRDAGRVAAFTPARLVLAANAKLVKFFTDLTDVLADGLSCRLFHEIKSQELFLLLRAYYSKEDLYGLFHDVVNQDSEFKRFVLAHYTEANDVADFASLANMSLRNFQRRFKAEFACSAREWLLAHKAARVLQALRTSDKDLMTIATEHGFSAMSYFTRFCKHNLGMTPTELRGNRLHLCELQPSRCQR